MKLLIDQGLPRSTAELLRQSGHDAVHTGEIGFATAEDREILERAKAEDRVIITFDSDFHTLLALAGADAPSVVRIRIEGLKAQDCADVIEAVLTRCAQDLGAGAAVSVSAHQIRIHKLPLTGG
jgi:predicted nuclease of predicted toxin-antitoxin system